MNSKQQINGKQEVNSKKQADFDAAFEKYAKTLTKDYIEQFKRPDIKVKSEKQKLNDAFRNGKTVEIVQKATGNKAHQKNLNLAKILNDDKVLEVKEVPKEIAIQIAKARVDYNLTQEQLAKKVSERVSVINDLEKGEGVYDPKVVERIENYLGVKFNRAWKTKN
jgi:putative transcription factor